MRKILISSIAALQIISCNKEDAMPKKVTESSSIETVSTEGTSKEKLHLKSLYEKSISKASGLRNLSSQYENSIYSDIANGCLHSNIYTLGGTYYISHRDQGKQEVRLRTTSDGSVWTNSPNGDEFTIKALPAHIGIPYLISHSEKYLGAGVLTSAGKKTSVAFMRADKSDLMGAGWSITPTEKGLVLTNDMFYTKNDESPNMWNIEHRVLTSSNNGRATLSSFDKNMSTQYFSIIPKGGFRVLGIRYFYTHSEVSDALYNSRILKTIDSDRQIHTALESSTEYPSTSPINFELEIQKTGELKVKRTFINKSEKDLELDLLFDDDIHQFSSFKEIANLTIPELHKMELPIPEINNNSIWDKSMDRASITAPYGVVSSKTRSLNGILYLLISPKTEGEVEYTYSRYRLKLPYVVFLRKVGEKNTNKVIKITGIWEGDIYIEDDSDRHTFTKRPIGGNTDDDDDFIIEMSNKELYDLGHLVRNNEARSLRSTIKRIRL